jgi:hypothetical protein
MNSVYMIDDKGREFEISYSYHKGRRGGFDPNFGNYYPNDPDEIVILEAYTTLGKGKKTREVRLTEKQLERYFDLYDIEEIISEDFKREFN